MAGETGYESDNSLKLVMSTDNVSVQEQGQKDDICGEVDSVVEGSDRNQEEEEKKEKQAVLSQEADDFAIAMCLQQELNCNLNFKQHTKFFSQGKQKRNTEYGIGHKRHKRNYSDDENDYDFICELSNSSSEKSDDFEKNEGEGFIVDEEFAGINDFRVNVGIYDDVVRYDKDGMIALEEEEIATESDSDSDHDQFQRSNLNFQPQINIIQNYTTKNQNKSIFQNQNGGKKSNVLRVKLNSENGGVNVLRCPTQFPEPKFQEPFFLFEQVASCVGDALKIFMDFLESDLVKIDSYPHFSHARRQRVYATNLRNHEKITNWPVEKRDLKQVLNWPMKKEFPVWTNSVFKIVPLKTILASNNLLVKKEDVEIVVQILDSFEQQTGSQTENEIKQFILEDVLCKMRKMNLVPDVNKTLKVLSAEQKEELMGYPIGYTNIFDDREIGSNACIRNKRVRNNKFNQLIFQNYDNNGFQDEQILGCLKENQQSSQKENIGVNLKSFNNTSIRKNKLDIQRVKSNQDGRNFQNQQILGCLNENQINQNKNISSNNQNLNNLQLDNFPQKTSSKVFKISYLGNIEHQKNFEKNYSFQNKNQDVLNQNNKFGSGGNIGCIKNGKSHTEHAQNAQNAQYQYLSSKNYENNRIYQNISKKSQIKDGLFTNSHISHIKNGQCPIKHAQNGTKFIPPQKNSVDTNFQHSPFYQNNDENILIENSKCIGCHIGHIKNGKCHIKYAHNGTKFSTPQKYLDAREDAIGKSFQVDTVTYLLSPIKKYIQQQNKKINVLSLFDGIGGTAVALYKLKIPVRKYYSSEINPFVKQISKKFVVENLREINPSCEFIDLGCIKNVNQKEFLNGLVGDEKIDLLVGGPPCSNLSGANRHQGEAGRSGVTGINSKLFFDYSEVLQHLRHLYNKIQ